MFTGLSIRLGPGLTVVVGPNESGKSTALAALADLLWGMPQRHPLAGVVPRAQLRLTVDLVGGTPLRTSVGAAGRDLGAGSGTRLLRGRTRGCSTTTASTGPQPLGNRRRRPA